MYTGNIYKIIWHYYSGSFKVFYTVNDRKGFFYEINEINSDMQAFMENASIHPDDFITTWEAE